MVNWPWPEMFAAVQRIAHSSFTFNEQMNKVYAFAAQNPAVYDAPDYWRAAVSSELPFGTIMAWARAGLEKLDPCDHWSLLMLDCGDCPDVFTLTDFPIRSGVSYEHFENIVRADVLRHGEEFPIPVEEERAPSRVAHHHVEELQHPILSYRSAGDFHGNNGYLLWLAVATFALCEMLRDVYFCKWILKRRKKMMLMSGFEEIFFYLGVVTEQGLRF